MLDVELSPLGGQEMHQRIRGVYTCCGISGASLLERYFDAMQLHDYPS